MPGQWSTKLYLLGCLQAVPALASIQWSPCTANPSLDCATLTVPLEYTDPGNGKLAYIPLARYNATVPKSQRKGSLLTNPGGPGSAGTDFLLNGAGKGMSNITGGFYDIVSWDPRGTGSARPLLQCFDTAGEEADASAAIPAAAEIEYSQFRNQSYMPSYYTALKDYDNAIAELAGACADHNSPALYTSSTSYVVRDMAAIIDALEGTDNATLNYWGFSYGTILGAEFIQTFPERVGKIIFDGVFDPAANARPYTSQLPNDELYVRDSINDLATFCTQAGEDGCSLSKAPGNRTTDIATRLANLQASLYESPIEVSDGSFSITVGMFSFFMYSYLKLPSSWPAVVSAVSALEQGNADPVASLLTGAAGPEVNASAPDTGSFAGWPIQCTDNAPSNHTTLPELAQLVLNISLAEQTPWLNADLSTSSFCRNFPNTRPKLPNLGASKLISGETNAILTKQNTSVLIVNGLHDAITPINSAVRLHRWLPTSSQLAVRRGPGHTTISLGSLGLTNTIREYLLDGALPATTEVYDVSQEILSSSIDASTITPDPVFNGTYSDRERMLLESTYDIYLAFVSLP
ncbi:Alpha/Beta hydrolase protein [Aspergillus pseudotamarii]|uniref:Alpha/Beta hydrolase protein n=1 Tax=Aspergillus pseudotamarii TaxID=132259 RepID=A0A5N6T6B2_ASPPS|nr:Alpha/Beta hydrolase protein [Aspergillus pseudotamarii]KAE8141868.1 Alpha/Beta hydrolase protein [Aspergillus pseudotamarii]